MRAAGLPGGPGSLPCRVEPGPPLRPSMSSKLEELSPPHPPPPSRRAGPITRAPSPGPPGTILVNGSPCRGGWAQGWGSGRGTGRAGRGPHATCPAAWFPQPTSGQGHPECQAQLGVVDRGPHPICPRSVDTDESRYPQKLAFAQCLCRGCISAKTGRETAALNSVPLQQTLLVLRRRPCSRDAAGPPTPGAFSFHAEFIRVPVGCTCVLPRSAQ